MKADLPKETEMPRLLVQGLSTSFMTEKGRITSVSEVSFEIPHGKTLALVGESGSGKSVTSLSLMGLHAKTSLAQVGGEAWFLKKNGERVNVLALSEAEKRSLRGHDMAMIFQEPMTSLNPVLTVGDQMSESVRLHKGMDFSAAMQHAKRMLDLVEIPAAERRLKEYPHQLSGGMRQRVMIALAMACDPALLIADEPTTALDVTIQAQILALMNRLQKETGMSLLFITHNLGVVAQYADDVAVMYFGRIVERGSVASLFEKPLHPYTEGLLACLPAIAVEKNKAQLQEGFRPRLQAIEGQVCSPFSPPVGCAFAPRCPDTCKACNEAMPELYALPSPDAGRFARCLKYQSMRGQT